MGERLYRFGFQGSRSGDTALCPRGVPPYPDATPGVASLALLPANGPMNSNTTGELLIFDARKLGYRS